MHRPQPARLYMRDFESDSASLQTTFWSISSDVDTVTGLDRRTNTKLPFWVSQFGSFDLKHVWNHEYIFRKNG